MNSSRDRCVVFIHLTMVIVSISLIDKFPMSMTLCAVGNVFFMFAAMFGF